MTDKPFSVGWNYALINQPWLAFSANSWNAGSWCGTLIYLYTSQLFPFSLPCALIRQSCQDDRVSTTVHYGTAWSRQDEAAAPPPALCLHWANPHWVFDVFFSVLMILTCNVTVNKHTVFLYLLYWVRWWIFLQQRAVGVKEKRGRFNGYQACFPTLEICWCCYLLLTVQLTLCQYLCLKINAGKGLLIAHKECGPWAHHKYRDRDPAKHS